MTCSDIVAPRGRSQSTGTRTRAHCSCLPHFVQAMLDVTEARTGPVDEAGSIAPAHGSNPAMATSNTGRSRMGSTLRRSEQTAYPAI